MSAESQSSREDAKGGKSVNLRDITVKKRDGLELTDDELKYVAFGAADGSLVDYQLAAFLMAVYFKGMTERETAVLTRFMADTGDTAPVVPGSVDKHSTGGVGDKTTLVIGPIAASLGVHVAKLSGRGLGFSGGTIDKLEAIPGFNTSLDPTDFALFVERDGIALSGATGNVAPADKRLYALRDVTGTVESLPLIASSIMSKKLASGADAIVLDVKYGSGAFMKTPEDALKLAEAMIKIGRDNGRQMSAAVTAMEQPLGAMVGNALEVNEAITTMRGLGPADFRELCVVLSALMLKAAGKGSSLAECRAMAENALDDGSAMAKFRRMLENQGGDVRVCDDTSLLKVCPFKREIKAERDGFITGLRGDIVGEASVVSGAGRVTKSDAIDHGAGIALTRKIGCSVKCGDTLALVYAPDEDRLARAAEMTAAAYTIGDTYAEAPKLIYEIIE